MIDLQDAIQQTFADDGLLSSQIEGYRVRGEQVEMAEAVADALIDESILVAEAGTGTGKTFAYLVPALLSGRKVIISTGTKNLQDQLFRRDLPLLRKTLSIPFQAALLKGRSNYLCHYRLAQAQNDPLLAVHSEVLHDLRGWLSETKTGDLSEDIILEEGSSLWPKVTSTIDNCLGSECPNASECFINEARKQAQESDIVVVNHHLLMSDMALKSSGQGEVLPMADAYIIDEAHQLPDIASQFLGDRISSHQIQELCRDTIREMSEDAADMGSLRDHAERTEAALATFKLSITERETRIPWIDVLAKMGVEEKLNDLIACIEMLVAELEAASERGKGLMQCHVRSEALLTTLHFFDAKQEDENLVLWTDIRPTSFTLGVYFGNVNRSG